MNKREQETIRHIRNSILHKGQAPSIRELMRLLDYKSPRSISLIINKLIEKGALERKPNGKIKLLETTNNDTTRAETVDIPLVGTGSCGAPMLAEENIEAMIPVSIKLARPPFEYFLLRAQGDSMNKAGIEDGNLALVKKQYTAQNKDIVVALIDGEATIKEFHLADTAIILKPRSTNKKHKPIILSSDFQIQGIVITSFPEI